MTSFDIADTLLGRHEDGFIPPDLVTPAQYYAAPAALPYQRLLFALLEDAIRCFQLNIDTKDRLRRILFLETEDWLFDPVGTAFMSCPVVCETLGIDLAALRRSLR